MRPHWLPQVFPGKDHMVRHRQRALTAMGLILVYVASSWGFMLLPCLALLVDDLLDGPEAS